MSLSSMVGNNSYVAPTIYVVDLACRFTAVPQCPSLIFGLVNSHQQSACTLGRWRGTDVADIMASLAMTFFRPSISDGLHQPLNVRQAPVRCLQLLRRRCVQRYSGRQCRRQVRRRRALRRKTLRCRPLARLHTCVDLCEMSFCRALAVTVHRANYCSKRVDASSPLRLWRRCFGLGPSRGLQTKPFTRQVVLLCLVSLVALGA